MKPSPHRSFAVLTLASTLTSAFTGIAVASLAPAISAQIGSRVVPPGFATVEGNGVQTHPFGRMRAGVQMIVDREWVSSPAGGVITEVRMRPNVDFRATQPAYTKSYRINLATVATAASAMTTDPVANRAGATPSTLFSGPINLPAWPAGPFAPAPFNIRFPLASPYVFAPTPAASNLLVEVETIDLSPAPGLYRIDAAAIRSSQITGIARDLVRGCTSPQGDSLDIDVVDSLLTVGGAVAITPSTTAAAGTFPTAVVLLGLASAQIDLGVVRMPGCSLGTQITASFSVPEVGGSYATTSVPIPPVATLEGANVFVQALGWALAPGPLVGSVTSNALGIRIGSGILPITRAQSIFTRDFTTWFQNTTAGYTPVIELVGSLP